MKLFTPKDSSVEYAKKHDSEIVKIAYLNTTLERLRLAIAREKDEFDRRMNEQRDIYSIEKEKLQQEVRELTDNVKSLRAQRASLLVPITGIREEAEALLSSAQLKEYNATKKEEELDDALLSLQSRLDTLSERETDFNKLSADLSMRIAGAREESEMIAVNHNKLVEWTNEARARVMAQDLDLSHREEAHKLKEEALRVAMEEFTKYKNEAERALADKRAALERAFTHIKNQK